MASVKALVARQVAAWIANGDHALHQRGEEEVNADNRDDATVSKGQCLTYERQHALI